MFDWGNKHRVGECQSIFYMEWAKLLVNNSEKDPNYERALEILKMGVEKKAQPAEALQEYTKKLMNAKAVYDKSNGAKRALVPEVPVKPVKAEPVKEQEGSGVKKFGFYYDLLKPNKHNDEEEYSFEEIRARFHLQVHEKTLKYQNQYSKQIEELKSK